MCGIVGYIDRKGAYPILIKGLRRLEYQKYDSAGVAWLSDNQPLNIYKAKNTVFDWKHFVAQNNIFGTLGITHTYWRSCKEIYSENSYSHYYSRSIALILKSIIKSNAILKEKSQAKSYLVVNGTNLEVPIQIIKYIKRTITDMILICRLNSCKTIVHPDLLITKVYFQWSTHSKRIYERMNADRFGDRLKPVVVK